MSGRSALSTRKRCKGEGQVLRHFFFFFFINAEIIVINQLSVVKVRGNDQKNFVIYHGCHGDGRRLKFSSINLLIFQSYLFFSVREVSYKAPRGHKTTPKDLSSPPSFTQIVSYFMILGMIISLQ